jgi:hypothetical protein
VKLDKLPHAQLPTEVVQIQTEVEFKEKIYQETRDRPQNFVQVPCQLFHMRRRYETSGETSRRTRKRHRNHQKVAETFLAGLM